MAKAVHFVAIGRVQGVFYRASAQRVGAHLGLSGWVRNRGDGAVEGHAQGDDSAVDALLDWCRRGPADARVDRLTSEAVPVDTSLTRFTIRP
jgi:acylphosphatase